MELSVIETNIITLVGTIVSLLVGLLVIDEDTARIVVSTAGTVVSIGFSLFAEMRVKAKVAAAAACEDTVTLQRVAGR